MSFINIYENYLNKLEMMSLENDEITDTEVRERLRDVINWYFIWGNPIDSDFPQKYAMFSAIADKKLAKATRKFIEDACKEAENISLGKNRHDLIENYHVQTKSGTFYDEFLGSSKNVLPAQKPSSDDYYNDY